MAVIPDEKDWTWVLDRPCPECGFDTSHFPRGTVGALIRQNALAWGAVLARPDVAIRLNDDRWSDLEYACHVRDVFRLYAYRLQLMLEQSDPTFPNWDQDAAAVDGGYRTEDAASVLVEIDEAARDLAASFDAVGDDQWSRTGHRSDAKDFTVESFARYMVHDPIHHLHDVDGAVTIA